MKRLVLGLMAATVLSVPAFAADIAPAIIYDLGGKFDKSFNEAAYNGAEKFKTETGIEYVEFEISNDAQREQALQRFAGDGRNPIVMAGFSWAAALEKVAAEYPDTDFAIIDMVVDAPNVRSVVYKEHEGSYLVGVMAAMASDSKKVGFIGGMDIPLIRKFGCGYAQGVKAVNPDATVVLNMTGDTPAAWNDPVKGAELTKAQKGQGADVI
jgi:basic membrane protein A